MTRLRGRGALRGVLFATVSFSAVCGGMAQAEEMPSREEMWQMIQAQQAQIDALKQQMTQTDTKVEATGARVDEIAVSGAGAGGSGGGGWWDRTQIGGYGEVHYNGGDADEVDAHRFVLFVGHDFNDDIRLFAELELEHGLVEDTADGSSGGEIELEQAYLEFDVAEAHSLTAGVQLIPVGILNETHEPPTFYGVERNPVERNIIPTTWWEAAAGARGQLGDGFSYDVMYHSGLEVPTTGGNAFKVRNGRGKVAQATAKDGAVTGRLTWTGMPGLELGVTGQYQSDVTQGAMATSATLFEAHVDASMAAGPGSVGFRALAARWDLDSAAAKAVNRDEQYGWYVEPSYRMPIFYGDLGVFARYSMWDNEAGGGPDSAWSEIDVGLNYWPHPDVVLKFDYQIEDRPAGGGVEDDRANLGVGFQF